MLDYADRRIGVIADRAPGGVGVHQVVERQFASVQLPGSSEAALAAAGGNVQRAALVRVFAITQAGDAGEPDGHLLRHLLFGGGIVREVVGHGGVIHRDVLKCLGGQGAPLLGIQARPGQGFGDPLVVGRVDDDGDGREILGRGPQHRGAADVDVFQGVVQRDIGLADGFHEGIEVDDNNINWADAVLFQLRHVRGRIAASQQAAVYHRVQGLDAALEDFGRAGDVGHLRDGNAGVGDAPVGAAGADQFIAGVNERLAEVLDTGLVEYAE